jgi:hypothetical protein
MAIFDRFCQAEQLAELSPKKQAGLRCSGDRSFGDQTGGAAGEDAVTAPG